MRTDDAAAPAVGVDGTLFFAVPIRGAGGLSLMGPPESQARERRGDDLDARGARIPMEDVNVHPILSPDGKWLVQPLIDGATANLWLVNTENGRDASGDRFRRSFHRDRQACFVVARQPICLCCHRRNRP